MSEPTTKTTTLRGAGATPGVRRVAVLLTMLAIVILTVSGCARRIPLSPGLAVSGLAELEERVGAAASPLVSFSAEVRLTYFGPGGRVRATGTLAVARPASLRYEVSGPHGGVVSAFATNGFELQALDVGSGRFVYGPATPANLDQLLPFAPLGLGPDAWVQLLFGEAVWPAAAELSYDDRSGRFVVTWEQGGIRRQIEIEPTTARLARARAFEGDRLLSDVRIESREKHGLPDSLSIEVPPAKIELEAKLRDIEPNAELDPSVFVLDPPAGIVPERLP